MPTLTTPASLGLEDDHPFAVHDAILEGFPVGALSRFETASQLPGEAIASVVRIPARTLARRRKGERFTPDESGRLFRLADLFHKAVGLFNGDVAGAAGWLQAPGPALGGRTPLEMARTEAGGRAVENLIGRLEHGVFT